MQINNNYSAKRIHKPVLYFPSHQQLRIPLLLVKPQSNYVNVQLAKKIVVARAQVFFKYSYFLQNIEVLQCHAEFLALQPIDDS